VSSRPTGRRRCARKIVELAEFNGPAITVHKLDNFVAATPRVIEHLDASFFRVRYSGLTALQQKYLRAMAELGAGSQKTGKIAGTLGVGPAAVATVRQQLIDKALR